LKQIEVINAIKEDRMKKANLDRIEAVKKSEKKKRLIEDSTLEVRMRKFVLDREGTERKKRVISILESGGRENTLGKRK
jgi:hypothetical protein